MFLLKVPWRDFETLNLIVVLFLIQGWIFLEAFETLTRPPNGRVHCKIRTYCTFLFLVFAVGSYFEAANVAEEKKEKPKD